MSKKRILTGIKATGEWMHIGNYFGMFRPLIENSKWRESFLMLADYHSLTSVHDPESLRKNKKRIICEFFALFPEDSEIIVFEQSQVQHINNMTWILSSVTPYSLMLRAHSFKDSQNKNSEINMATFNYPILMTADIISYDVDIVPVWKDQKQHLEFARDIAQNFNKTYKQEFFKLPEAHIEESVMTIPGIDGRKMSKSYNNFLWVFDDEKTLKKKIMSIPTGSEGLDDPKDPDNCTVFSLIQLFASSEKQSEIRQKYAAWGYGYGHAKLELLDLFVAYYAQARDKYEYYLENFHELEKKLNSWNSYANSIATKKFNSLIQIIGL